MKFLITIVIACKIVAVLSEPEEGEKCEHEFCSKSIAVAEDEQKLTAMDIKMQYPLVSSVWSFLGFYAMGAADVNRKYILGTNMRQFDYDKDVPESLTDTVAIISGGSRGIGWECAKTLLARGCHVIVASSAANGDPIDQLREKLMQDVTKDGEHMTGRLEVWHLDLSSMSSVVQFAKRFDESGYHLNVLVNSAGILSVDEAHKLTNDGFESHLAINYLSNCLFTSLLLPHLQRTGQHSGRSSRIINVSSIAHLVAELIFDDLNGERHYTPYHAYSQSKLALIMFTYKLHDVLSQYESYDRVNVLTLHPGIVSTSIFDGVWMVEAVPFITNRLFKTAREGSETVLFAGFSPELEGVGGKYLEDCAITSSSPFSYGKQEQDRLWLYTRAALSQWLEGTDSVFKLD